jgi:hypothetical protein
MINAPRENRPMFKFGTRDHYESMVNAIDPELPVEIYRNLHKNCWSVRQRGKVKFHTDYICVKDAELKVSQKGRERVLREKRKNVHAFIKGYICTAGSINAAVDDAEWTDINYNPYKYDSFVDAEENPVQTARYVDMMIDPYIDNNVMAII